MDSPPGIETCQTEIASPVTGGGKAQRLRRMSAVASSTPFPRSQFGNSLPGPIRGINALRALS